eukprot:scaffold1912_cov167-Amphora_coffeaeformis.AAC.45
MPYGTITNASSIPNISEKKYEYESWRTLLEGGLPSFAANIFVTNKPNWKVILTFFFDLMHPIARIISRPAIAEQVKS